VGKNKLAKFAEMAEFKNVIQVSAMTAERNDHPLKGNWSELYFGNGKPIVLELGCGKGEYTIALAEKYPEKNYIGIDIKGARMYTGAKAALKQGLGNVAFLRADIDQLEFFFGHEEVDEIWLTFPDPQMKKARHRLTSTYYMSRYSYILKKEGLVHLKTDSRFLFDYTRALVNLNRLKVVSMTDNLYQSDILNELLNVKTFYEKQWIDRGIDIKYLAFIPVEREGWREPEERFEKDSYRSFGRSARE
jgi:tRNA (guanine-N7-)-methyltransferase